MKVLFIPCAGDGQAHKIAEGVSRSQHAAREYHRNAKLRKAKTKVRHGHDSRKSSKPSSTTAAGQSEVAERKLKQESPVKILLGASRSDPFDTIGDFGAPFYVHEMLDHAISHHWSEMYLSDGGGSDGARTEIMQSVMH